MKTKILKILVIVTIFFFSNLITQTQANDYEYKNLDITANILKDGTIQVLEDFSADFFVYKHGIIRDIPFNYSVDGKKFNVNIYNIDVRGYNYSVTNGSNQVSIKIGSASKELIGEHKYPISYDIYGLIRNFSGFGYSELYWNLVGYDFDTSFDRVRAELILPQKYTGFTTGDFLITTDGKTKTLEEFEGKVDRSQGDRIIITYNKRLPAYNGITLAIKFPNNYFEFDHKRQASLVGYRGTSLNNSSEFKDNFTVGTIVIGFFALILMIPFIIKKIRSKISNSYNGRIRGGYSKKYPVIVQYDPPKGLTSAEVGLLYHRKAIPKDLLSLIYQRAVRKLIKIEVGDDKKITITKMNEIEINAPSYEKVFFDNFMNTDVVKLPKRSPLNIVNDLSLLENYGITNNRLMTNETGRNILIAIGAYVLLAISPILAIVLLLIYNLFLDRMKETEEGAKLISHILGYKIFLEACEENQLRAFLKEDPLYFDKVLPYAIAFGIETVLLKKVGPILKDLGMYDTKRDVYNSISSSLNSSVRSVNSSSSSYSSSSGFGSGSGFGGGGSFHSGGGGGGGGGRSW